MQPLLYAGICQQLDKTCKGGGVIFLLFRNIMFLFLESLVVSQVSVRSARYLHDTLLAFQFHLKKNLVNKIVTYLQLISAWSGCGHYYICSFYYLPLSLFYTSLIIGHSLVSISLCSMYPSLLYHSKRAVLICQYISRY